MNASPNWIKILIIGGMSSFLILIVLPIAVLQALNPANQIEKANNFKRRTDLTHLYTAIQTYSKEHDNQLPPGINTTMKKISTRQLNLCPLFLPAYLPKLPSDPQINSSITDCSTPYNTGYEVGIDSVGHLVLKAPLATTTTPITVP